MRSVRRSAAASEAARFTAVVVFPTPPFWFAMVRTWVIGRRISGIRLTSGVPRGTSRPRVVLPGVPRGTAYPSRLPYALPPAPGGDRPRRPGERKLVALELLEPEPGRRAEPREPLRVRVAPEHREEHAALPEVARAERHPRLRNRERP